MDSQFAPILRFQFFFNFKIPPQIPGRKSVDGVDSDGVGHAKHAREDSPDVSPGFGFNCYSLFS
jgi:hypothetical protein